MKDWIVFLVAIIFIFSCNGEDKKSSAPAATTVPNNGISTLEDLVKKNPDSARFRMKLINTFDSLQMYAEAIGHTDSLIKKDSINNELWLAKAQLQESNRDTAGAVLSYTRALNIYPTPVAQLSLANLFAENRNKKSLLICDNVRKMNLGRETDADCNFIAGVFYARTGSGKKALELFDLAINDNYTLMEAYMEKGFIYYDAKNYKEAMKIFETASTVNNMYADAWYWKAKCFEAMGNKNEAIINYQRSLGLDKQLKEAREALERLKS